MREIKFRGKPLNRPDITGGWAYGSLCYDCNEKPYIDIQGYVDGFGVHYEHLVAQNTIGQFTGLKDINGKDIYEGDIVRVTQVRPKAEPPRDRGIIEVKFSIWNGWCVGTRWDRYEQSPNNPIDILEIIGNIHDNPELLKGGNL